MLNRILTELTPTTTEALNTMFWISLVLGIAAAFGVALWVLNRIEDTVQRQLTDLEPRVEDPTERKRLHAIVEWKR